MPDERAGAAGGKRYRGEVALLFAFDIAYDMKGRGEAAKPLNRLLGRPLSPFSLGTDKRMPREFFFYRPLSAELEPARMDGPTGTVEVRRSVKVFPIGALSVTLRVPIEADRLEDLIGFHDWPAAWAEATRIAEAAARDLSPWLVRPAESIREEEPYLVFCFRPPLPGVPGEHGEAEKWLNANRRSVAAMLTQESDPDRLSDQEVLDTIGDSMSYYKEDLVVLDWDAAFVAEEPDDLESVLYLMEIAGVQSTELEVFDRLLDRSLRDAYSGLSGRGKRARAAILSDLRELRIDMERLTDELSNITKFVGEWHLARLYHKLSDLFHFTEWHRSVEAKLKTLDDLYRMAKQDQTNAWMMILEATIVGLFIIDLVLLFMLSGR